MRLFLATVFFAFYPCAQRVFAADDLITADKTLLVQFVIFLAALYLLNNLFFKPLIELADKRDKATSGSGKEAVELTEKAAEMSERYDAEVKQARERALAQRARLAKAALAEAEEIIASAKREARSLLEKRTSELAVQVDRAKTEMRSEIEDIANLITRAVKTEPGDV